MLWLEEGLYADLPFVNILPCQQNLTKKTLQNETNIKLITKSALIFSSEIINGQTNCQNLISKSIFNVKNHPKL